MVRRAIVLLLALGSALLSGCTGGLDRTPVPAALVDRAAIAGIPNARFWGDQVPANLDALIAEQAKQAAGRPPHRANYLALSGGGSDGAFGAGLIVGWTRSGQRPEFDIVTGISTGALIAPFAFLGPAYDAKLRKVYTGYDTSQIATADVLGGLLGGPALSDDSQLKQLIAQFITPDLVAAVGTEHRKGRRLLVGTTNLDSGRPVVWDLGEIATSGRPNAVSLFRQVVLASAAVPGVFPPVLFDVSVNGQTMQEMHVDGGTTTEVFFLPVQVLRLAADNPNTKGRSRLFVISNGKLKPEYEAVADSTLAIVKQSVKTLIKSQWNGDLAGLLGNARSAGIDVNLASVPQDFSKQPSEPFDPVYMRALFQNGYAAGATGSPWRKELPGPADH